MSNTKATVAKAAMVFGALVLLSVSLLTLRDASETRLVEELPTGRANRERWDRVCNAPNRFAGEAEVVYAETGAVAYVTSYQTYERRSGSISTSDAYMLSKISMVDGAVRAAVRGGRLPHGSGAGLLTGASVMDVGAASGFFLQWSYLRGASPVIAVDMDEQYLHTVRELFLHFDFPELRRTAPHWEDGREVLGELTLIHSAIQDLRSDVQADVVIAFAIVHWLYACSHSVKGDVVPLDSIVAQLRRHTKTMLLVEWIDPSDDLIKVAEHFLPKGSFDDAKYSMDEFEQSLQRHFASFEWLGDTSLSMRSLYVAHVY